MFIALFTEVGFYSAIHTESHTVVDTGTQAGKIKGWEERMASVPIESRGAKYTGFPP